MSDKLAEIFKRYTLGAQVFFSGTLCGSQTFDNAGNVGHLHLIRRGTVTVRSPEHETLVIHEPSLLFYPQATIHHFRVHKHAEAELVCARIEFGAAAGNPLLRSLPACLRIPLAGLANLAATLDLLIQETMGERCGRQAAIDRLCEFLLIQLLRHVMDEKLMSSGLLAGLADTRLSKAIAAMHDDPGRNWSLEEQARIAGMSRARFAVHFRDTVGATPGVYLAQWRIGLAQALLKKGKAVGLIADEIGYGSAAALSRAFKAHTGLTPTGWQRGGG